MKTSTPSTGQYSFGPLKMRPPDGIHTLGSNTQRLEADSQKKGTASKDFENSRRIDLFSLCCTFLLSAPL